MLFSLQDFGAECQGAASLNRIFKLLSHMIQHRTVSQAFHCCLKLRASITFVKQETSYDAVWFSCFPLEHVWVCCLCVGSCLWPMVFGCNHSRHACAGSSTSACLHAGFRLRFQDLPCLTASSPLIACRGISIAGSCSLHAKVRAAGTGREKTRRRPSPYKD